MNTTSMFKVELILPAARLMMDTYIRQERIS
jgi:hypothetical protein